MAVITQNYDIDLKATGEFPVVKMSQFDTGSRTIVFTVYDGHELAAIDGMVARVDGTRSDGVEFSSTCTVGTGSKVSFTINQEMTKHAGRHAAELVIFDASGNPAGTQNFVIDVEPATMVRDSAASADDRTLYDQYTDSVEQKFSELSTSLTTKADALNKTVEDISGLVGASSKSVEILNTTLDTSTVSSTLSGKIYCRVVYDPLTALVTCRVSCDNSTLQKAGNGSYYFELGILPESYLPEARLFDYVDVEGHTVYRFFNDSLGGAEASAAINRDTFGTHHANAISYTMICNSTLMQDAGYRPDFTVSWYARGGKYIGVTPIGTGGNTLSIGTTTTGKPGTQASVTNSGTAKDVVLDFTIPRGADGSSTDFAGTGDNSILVTRNGSTASGKNSIRIGNIQAGIDGADGADSIAIGRDTNAAEYGIAIGWSARTSASQDLAIGYDAGAGGGKSIAFGVDATATAYSSVAIGDKSEATEDNTVSFGSQTTKRRIVNIGAPTADTDAATKAYVDALEAKVTALEARVAALEAK